MRPKGKMGAKCGEGRVDGTSGESFDNKQQPRSTSSSRNEPTQIQKSHTPTLAW